MESTHEGETLYVSAFLWTNTNKNPEQHTWLRNEIPGSYEFLKLRIGAAANAVRVGPAAAAMCCGCHAPTKPFLTPGARKVNSGMKTMQSMHWC